MPSGSPLHRCARAALAIGALATVAASASADPALDFVFTETTGVGTTGHSVIAALPGDLLTAELWLHAGPEGVSSFAFSFDYDADLRDELDIVEVAASGLPGGLVPLVPVDGVESDAVRAGSLSPFTGVTFGDGPAGERFVLGRIVFRVTDRVANDGPDARLGVRGRVDGVFDNQGVDRSSALVAARATVDDAAQPARCAVAVAKPSYVNGEVIRFSTLRFRNVSAAAFDAVVRVTLSTPSPPGIEVVVLALPATPLPAEFDEDLAPVDLVAVAAELPRGAYAVRCRLEDPVDGTVLAEGQSVFRLE